MKIFNIKYLTLALFVVCNWSSSLKPSSKVAVNYNDNGILEMNDCSNGDVSLNYPKYKFDDDMTNVVDYDSSHNQVAANEISPNVMNSNTSNFKKKKSKKSN